MLDSANSRLFYTAVMALIIGVLVYLVDRQADVYFLSGTSASINSLPQLFGDIGRNLPSFVHCYAFILMTVVCLTLRRSHVYIACAGWLAIEILFELGQHPQLKLHLASLIPEWFDRIPVLESSTGFFLNGYFDPLDILAATLGAVAALLTIEIVRRNKNESA